MKLDQAYFEKNLPTPDPAFETRALRKLRQQAQPQRRRLPMGTALVLGMLLMLTLATALAIGLTYSKDFQHRKTAREAVMEKYQLTEDVFAVLSESISKDGDTDIFTYAYEGVPAIGVYTVEQKDNRILSVSWSHDNDKLGWGQKEIEAMLMRNRTVYASSPLPESNLDEKEMLRLAKETLAENAALDELARQNGQDPQRYNQGLPTANEIQLERALNIAHEALSIEYGIALESFKAGETDCYFYISDTRQWHFWAFPIQREFDESYWITLDAMDGTILNMGHDAGGNG